MIFYYYGEDSFRAQQKIKAIVAKFTEKIDRHAHNVHWLDGETISSDDFFQTISASGFLAEKKLIVIKNLQNNGGLGQWQEALFKYLKSQNDTPDENYLIFWQTDKPDARTKLYKQLKQFKFAEEFTKLNAGQLNKWITNTAKSRGRQIEKSAVSALVAYVGNDLWQISNELDKLAAYCSKNITVADVEDLVQAKIDDNIFTLVDALGQKNKAAALKLLEERLNSGQAPQYLLSMIIRQYRLLIKVKALGDKLTSSAGLAPTLKIHPVVADKAWQQSRLYSLDELKNAYQSLLVLDELFKTTSKQEAVLFAQMINSL